jgi:hypothetical protein
MPRFWCIVYDLVEPGTNEGHLRTQHLGFNFVHTSKAVLVYLSGFSNLLLLKHVFIPALKIVVFTFGFSGPAINSFFPGQVVAMNIQDWKQG